MLDRAFDASELPRAVFCYMVKTLAVFALRGAMGGSSFEDYVVVTQKTTLAKELCDIAACFKLDQPHVKVAILTLGLFSFVLKDFMHFNVEVEVIKSCNNVLSVKGFAYST